MNSHLMAYHHHSKLIVTGYSNITLVCSPELDGKTLFLKISYLRLQDKGTNLELTGKFPACWLTFKDGTTEAAGGEKTSVIFSSTEY